MDLLDPREPVSTWTHGAGLLLALVGLVVLGRRARVGGRGRRLGLLVYGLSLAFCYGASTLYHGVRVAEDRLDAFDRLDRIGIFLLIAGTYTPLAGGLLRGRWRWVTLASVWLVAAVASTALALGRPLPTPVGTGLYLAMGWGSVALYAELARVVSHRALRPLIVGGLLYSAGAVVNLLRWPDPLPGRVGPHELFHLFVMAGSLAHFRLIRDVVATAPAAPGGGRGHDHDHEYGHAAPPAGASSARAGSITSNQTGEASSGSPL
jgi:hemolysin III